MANLTESEKRAFAFGPWMRRLANLERDGRLGDAHSKFATPERLSQHEADVASIPLSHRDAFVRAIDDADRGVMLDDNIQALADRVISLQASGRSIEALVMSPEVWQSVVRQGRDNRAVFLEEERTSGAALRFMGHDVELVAGGGSVAIVYTVTG